MEEKEIQKKVNGLGIAGFVIGLLSLWSGMWFCITPILGVILSAIGVSKKDKYSYSGLAIAGLVLSIISLVFWGIIWLFLGGIGIAASNY